MGAMWCVVCIHSCVCDMSDQPTIPTIDYHRYPCGTLLDPCLVWAGLTAHAGPGGTHHASASRKPHFAPCRRYYYLLSNILMEDIGGVVTCLTRLPVIQTHMPSPMPDKIKGSLPPSFPVMIAILKSEPTRSRSDLRHIRENL